jgi:hypothetical protein
MYDFVMDPSVPKDATWFFGQLWSTIVVALVIYGGGLTANRIVKALWAQTADLVDGKAKAMDPKLPLLFRLWYTTRLSHPFVVGALLSFIPELPHPDFADSRTSAALWFGFAGMGNSTIHELVEAATRQVMKVVESLAPWIRQKLGMRPSSRPPPPPAVAAITEVAAEPAPTLADTLEPDEKRP